TMCGQLFHIPDLQAVRRQDPTRRVEGEIGEMLVVDGVELTLRYQFHQVRKLDRDHTLGRQCHGQPGHKIVDVGHVGQHIVRHDQVCCPALAYELRCKVAAKEALQRLDLLLPR